jgi:hypothetical protein
VYIYVNWDPNWVPNWVPNWRFFKEKEKKRKTAQHWYVYV